MGHVQSGRIRRLAFARAPAVAWLLPLYELALFTAPGPAQHEIGGLDVVAADLRVAARWRRSVSRLRRPSRSCLPTPR